MGKYLYTVKYIAFWLSFFVAARLLFVLFYWKQTAQLGIGTTLGIFQYGLIMDFSMIAYLSFIPLLLLFVFNANRIFEVVVKAYTMLCLFVLTLLMLVDLQLYQHWQFRLDATITRYLNTPKDMLASSSNLEIGLSVIIFLLLVGGVFWLYQKYFHHKALQPKRTWKEIPTVILTFSIFVIMIRGGLQTIPLNQSNVYFSNQLFANHAAINYAWNFTHSILKNAKHNKNHYAFLSKEESAQTLQQRRAEIAAADTIKSKLLRVERPNVLLIIWESFTAKVVAPLGGEKDVTPYFNALTKEGILFSRIYANGDRTDKGLVATLSGYYPQPNASILQMPKKSQGLPTLSAELAKIGYHNAFYYGGDLNFANMYSYLCNKDIPLILNRNDFGGESARSKWGIYDHVVFDSLQLYLANEAKQPFFTTFMTLSSHEPFDIPGEYKFGKGNDVELFKSSLAYTDESLGKFIEAAKKAPWWDNTIVIILADHGHRSPPVTGVYNHASQYHIPMLWLGGALAVQDTVISNIGSQSDLSHTLLKILGGDVSKFIFSNNLLVSSPARYAHYIFNQGFGTITEKGAMVFDYNQKKIVHQEGEDIKNIESLGKIITQQAYQDFLDR